MAEGRTAENAGELNWRCQRHECLLGAATGFKKTRAIATAAQPEDLQIHAAGGSRVAVATGAPVVAALAVSGSALRLDIHFHQSSEGKLQRLFEKLISAPWLIILRRRRHLLLFFFQIE